MKLTLNRPDTFGALASALCLVHCFATPFIFIAHSCAAGGCVTSPVWWRSLDYIFLIISFFAVLKSAKNTSKNFMKPLLWASWFSLFFLIVNEKIQLLSLPETVTYIIAIVLAALHIYNLKYCQCKTNNCCSNNG
ncbi:MerC domain-containing protein [Cellulophaga lytica]|uniref:MerC domain-containing protein n=1 Tax=Cellulophaga lytica TaxID=979 RepID=UPI000B5CCECF|nr:MerC domain-containing protein [Cellulophaga lytica]MDO6853532.1 MerC domain-containing protein [Cellulophaga lytica]SNQ43661.1 Conserved hypothetical membrane protein [Cellulophaga lytica]